MSYEIEKKVLGALIHIADPADLKVQQAMISLNKACFIDKDSIAIFNVVSKFYKNKEWFGYEHLEKSVSKDNYETFIILSSEYYSIRSLQEDVNFLVDSERARRVGKNIKTMADNFKNEGSPKIACESAIDSAIQLAREAMIDDDNITHIEKLIDDYLMADETEILIPTGIESMDDVNNGGFRVKSLITVAGRSGMGKTGFATHLAFKLASNHPAQQVLFFSLEMSKKDILEKYLASIVGKQPKFFTSQEKSIAIARSLEVPLSISDRKLATIDYIETSSRLFSLKNPISVIVVDYINVVQNEKTFESHALRQADIAMRLAALAIELNCIVIVLCQVNRDYANRQDKCPITSDAADSSGSERSSGYWLGIHRPGIDDDEDKSLDNKFIVKCRKNRWGKPWKVIFNFNAATFGETNQIFPTNTSKKVGVEKWKEEKYKNNF